MTAHITGAPLEFDFDGKTYLFYPLRDKDYGEFEIWAQDRYIQTTKRNLEGLSEDQQKLLLMNAFEHASLITFASAECKAMMQSVEGAAKLVHLSLRRGEPDITLDDVRIMCTNPDFVVAAFAKIATLTSPYSTSRVEAKKKERLSQGKKSIKRSRKGTAGRHKRLVK